MSSPSRSAIGLAAIILALCVVRVPVLWRAAGGLDEELFAVPGWTVWTEGLPRIPYMPERSAEIGFRGSERALFALPPFWFVWQAPWQAACGPGYSSGRLAALAAGAVAIGLVWAIGRQCGLSCSAALAAAGAYSLSRGFYFPAIAARPDMLCTCLELAAVSRLLAWTRAPRPRRLVESGVCLGLAGLTHPVAVVCALQLAVCVLLCRGPGRFTGWGHRARSVALLTAVALTAFSLWLIFIVQAPDLFREQFVNNVFGPTRASGLLQGLTPLQLLATQSPAVIERLGWLQLALMLAGIGAAILLSSEEVRTRTLGWLALSGLVLLFLLVRPGHPLHGYLSYPVALSWIGLAQGVGRLAGRLPRTAALPVIAWGALAIALLPGSGLRTTLAAYRDWPECLSDRACFVSRLLEQIPLESRLVVDPAFVFDVYLTGRPTTLAVFDPQVHRDRLPTGDVLIVSRHGLDNRHPDQFGGRRWFALGEEQNLAGCFAVVYAHDVAGRGLEAERPAD